MYPTSPPMYHPNFLVKNFLVIPNSITATEISYSIPFTVPISGSSASAETFR